jgi:LuxR family maltose regulon positive regulatory protein
MQEPEPIVDSPDSLTQREKEILILLLRGASDREISEQLLISIHTVKDYGKSIRSKYQVKSRLQLISALLGRSQEPAASVSSAR